AFKRSAMAIRAHRPITVVRILDRIDHLLLSIDQLQMIAAMAEFAGKISYHRNFLSVPSNKIIRAAADHQKRARSERCVWRKGELHAFGKRPVRQIDLGRTAIEQFDELQLLQIVWRVIHDLVDQYIPVSSPDADDNQTIQQAG